MPILGRRGRSNWPFSVPLRRDRLNKFADRAKLSQVFSPLDST